MEKYFELSVRTKAQLADAATSVERSEVWIRHEDGGLYGSGGYQYTPVLMLQKKRDVTTWAQCKGWKAGAAKTDRNILFYLILFHDFWNLRT